LALTVAPPAHAASATAAPQATTTAAATQGIQATQAAQATQATSASTTALATLPAEFDVREVNSNGVTPERSQGTFESCEAFAMAASAEWSIAKNGAVQNPTNLSTAFLAQASNDFSVSSSWRGATSRDTTAVALSRFLGAYTEVTYPYTKYMPGGTGSGLGDWQIATPDPATSEFHFREYLVSSAALWVNGQFNPAGLEQVKTFMYQHGVIIAAIEGSGPRSDISKAMYEPHVAGADHSVALIAWDDNYPKAYFRTEPPGDGAFLVKNSHGTFHWISYYDRTLSSFAYLDLGGAYTNPGGDGLQYAYWADNTQPDKTANPRQASRTFEIPQDRAAQELRALNVETTAPGVTYTVRVFLDLRGGGVTDGVAQPIGPGGATAITVTAQDKGLHRVDLTVPVVLQPGERFAVVVDYQTDQGVAANWLYTSTAYHLVAYSADAAPAVGLTGVTLPNSVLTGQTVTPTVTGNLPAGTTFTYQWYNINQALASATASTFTVPETLSGGALTVRVTARAPGYSQATLESSAVLIQSSAQYACTSYRVGGLAVIGLGVVGRQVRSVYSYQMPADGAFVDTWTTIPNGTAVTVGTGPTYTVTAAEQGLTLSLSHEIERFTCTYGAYAYIEVLPAPAPSLPPPYITYTSLAEGATLTANPAAGTPAGATLAYRWYRNGTLISGSVGQNYVIKAADLGSAISVEALWGNTRAAESAAVYPQGGTISIGQVILSGLEYPGRTISVQVNQVVPTDATLTYQWRLDGVAIAGATTSSYVVRETDINHTLDAAVTATKPGSQSATKVSNQRSVMAIVSIDGLSLTGYPPVVGGTMTAAPVGVYPADATVSYTWYHNGGMIASTEPSYSLANAQAGDYVSVTVRANKEGWYGGMVTSDWMVVQAACSITGVSIGGTPQVGQTLTATATGVAPAGATVTYQWYRSGQPILGQRGATYVVTEQDTGTQLTVQATVVKPDYGPAWAEAAPVTVTGPLPAPTFFVTLQGSVVVGETVNVGVGNLNPPDATVTYEWYVGGVRVAGPRAINYYTIQPADYDKVLVGLATATTPGGPSTSHWTVGARVGLGRPTFQVTLSGTPEVGETLVGTVTGLDPADAQLAYQWQRDGVDMPGVTGTSYQIQLTDQRKWITLKVTASAPDRPDGIYYAYAGAIPDAKVKLTGVTLQGSPAVGQTLTAVPVGQGAATTVTYQWYRGTSVIAGVTGTTYQLTAADAGRDLVVKATARVGSLDPVVKYSNHAQVVGLTGLTIAGTAAPGQTLTAAADYLPAGGTLNLQWYRGTAAITGAKSASYTLTTADAGQDISLKATVSSGGFTSAAKYSNHVKVLGASSVTVMGTAKVGQTLTAAVVAEPAGAVVTCHWFRGSSLVGTGPSYVVKAADAGQDMVLKVTVAQDGLGSQAKYSAHFTPAA
jgi:hypothetical protein